MSTVEALLPRRRGTELLLAHCGLLPKRPAAERLRAELGCQLAATLVSALMNAQGAGRRRRGSSSP